MSDELKKLASDIIDGVNAAFASRTPDGQKVPFLKDTAKDKIEAAIRLFIDATEQQQAARIAELEHLLSELPEPICYTCELPMKSRGALWICEPCDNHYREAVKRISELEASVAENSDDADKWLAEAIEVRIERDSLRERVKELEAGSLPEISKLLSEAMIDRDRFKAEAERLKADAEILGDSVMAFQRTQERLESELATLRPRAECAKELSEALDILESYVDHSPNCRGEGSYMKGCDCGVNIARTASKEALAKYRALP